MPSGIYSATTTHREGRTMCVCMDFTNKGTPAGGGFEKTRSKKAVRRIITQLENASKNSNSLSAKLKKEADKLRKRIS